MFKSGLFAVARAAGGHLRKSITVLHKEELSGEYVVTRGLSSVPGVDAHLT